MVSPQLLGRLRLSCGFWVSRLVVGGDRINSPTLPRKKQATPVVYTAAAVITARYIRLYTSMLKGAVGRFERRRTEQKVSVERRKISGCCVVIILVTGVFVVNFEFRGMLFFSFPRTKVKSFFLLLLLRTFCWML